jgi:hypothetical protein
MTLQKIRLELARNREFPEGSNRRGYEFVGPLDGGGHLDPAQWKKNRDRCIVRRFWANEDDEYGHLVRKPGGLWAFHYDVQGDEDDDETGYRFANHKFSPGEYVSIRDDENLRTFRVVRVEAIEIM